MQYSSNPEAPGSTNDFGVMFRSLQYFLLDKTKKETVSEEVDKENQDVFWEIHNLKVTFDHFGQEMTILLQDYSQLTQSRLEIPLVSILETEIFSCAVEVVQGITHLHVTYKPSKEKGVYLWDLTHKSWIRTPNRGWLHVHLDTWSKQEDFPKDRIELNTKLDRSQLFAQLSTIVLDVLAPTIKQLIKEGMTFEEAVALIMRTYDSVVPVALYVLSPLKEPKQ